MGKGNGTSRASSSNSPKGISEVGGGEIASQEKSIKAGFAEKRQTISDDLDRLRNEKGVVGKLVNKEINSAIDKAEDALKMFEEVQSVQDTYFVHEKVGKELRSAAYRLMDLAQTHEANAYDATGKAKNTYSKAATALRQAAYEIGESIKQYGYDDFAKLEDIYRSQNKWK